MNPWVLIIVLVSNSTSLPISVGHVPMTTEFSCRAAAKQLTARVEGMNSFSNYSIDCYPTNKVDPGKTP